MKITWHDSGREPTQQPDPKYPNGIDLDFSGNVSALKKCRVELPHPAKRCGYYLVKCEACGYVAMCTTAGRADDPRSVTIPCKVTLQ